MKFGLITEETDIEDLIGMVQTIGKQVEESSKVRNYCQVKVLIILDLAVCI